MVEVVRSQEFRPFFGQEMFDRNLFMQDDSSWRNIHINEPTLRHIEQARNLDKFLTLD